MILDKKRKIAIFLNPRCGSTSLVKLFSSIDLKISHTHRMISEINIVHPELFNYSFYAFYRNPMERFISAYSHYREKYNGTLSIDEFLYSEPKVPGFIRLLMPQINWIGSDKINLLDFRKFTEETTKLASLFGLSPVDVPFENGSLNKNFNLSEMQIQSIQYKYRKDYDFFNSKGIDV